jgi:hypothetical protein
MHASSFGKAEEVEQIFCTVPQARHILSCGTQGIYDLLGAGKIKGVKRGSRTLLVVESLRAYAAELIANQPAVVAPPKPRKPQRQREVEAIA